MSDTRLPLPRAELVALFTESLVFGAFSVLYAIAIWILLYRTRKRTRTRLNKLLSATCTVMYILSIVHLGLDITRALRGFTYPGATEAGTEMFYARLNDPTHVTKSVIYITMTVISDSFITYRLFIVWNHNRLIVLLPIALILATAVAGYGACTEFTFVRSAAAIFESNLVPWITAFFSLSLATNILATLLITARLVWVNRRVRQFRAGGGSWEVVETLIQSAVIYSAALLALLVTYVAGSNAQYICLDVLQPLMGVTFTLIIIRVGLGYTTGEETTLTGGPITTIGGTPHGASREEHGMKPMAINVSVTRTDDRRSFDRRYGFSEDVKDAVGMTKVLHQV